MDIITILILPIHEDGMCFHLFLSSVSFITVLIVFRVQVSYLLFHFILGLVVVFDAIIQEIVFLISLSDSY